MPDYIDREKIFPICFDTNHPEESIDKLVNRIFNIPSADVVEVVRCKDCEHNVFEQANKIIHCNRTGKTVFREYDDFCKYGQRKVDNGNL